MTANTMPGRPDYATQRCPVCGSPTEWKLGPKGWWREFCAKCHKAYPDPEKYLDIGAVEYLEAK